MDVFERKRIRLTAISPIHIGSVEQRLTPFEYIEHKGYVYPISEERLSQFLFKTGLLNLFLSRIQHEGHRFRIHSFFKENRVLFDEKRLLELSGGRRTRLRQGSSSELTEYRPFIRDGFNRVYIPGTSIKGVIRTAILFNVLKKFKQKNQYKFKQQIEEEISKRIDSDKKKKKKRDFFEWEMKTWLENFFLEEISDNRKPRTKTPNTDWLRMLHVSDAYPMGEVETRLIPVNILKKERVWRYKKENSGRNTTIWVETVPDGTVFEFEVTWDRRLLEEFKRFNKRILLPEGIDGVLKDLQSFAKDVYDFEKDFTRGSGLEAWYRDKRPDLRIGFGSGMLSTTIALLLPEELRKKIRNYAGKNKGDEVAPKSRRVWVEGGSPTPLGWAVLEVV